jgi:hypothetical protein
MGGALNRGQQQIEDGFLGMHLRIDAEGLSRLPRCYLGGRRSRHNGRIGGRVGPGRGGNRGYGAGQIQQRRHVGLVSRAR